MEVQFQAGKQESAGKLHVGRERPQSASKPFRYEQIEKGDVIARAVTLISNQLHEMMRIAERWTIGQRSALLLTRLLRRWLGGKALDGVPAGASLFLSG